MSKPIDCPSCNGRGKIYQSCCGVDMYPYEDVPLCPICGEWQGGPEDQGEECEDCNGTEIVEG